MQTPELNRGEFIKTAAATGAVAALATAGFTRTAHADHHGEQIVQLAMFGYKPDKKDAAIEALAGLAKKVEENEPGVLAYVPYLNEKDNQVTFYEIYKNQEALTNHGKMPYMADLRPMFGPDGAFAPPLKIVKLTKAGGFHR